MKKRIKPQNYLGCRISCFVVAMLFLSLPGSAQQQKFPAWMDEVDFSQPADNGKIGFNEPQGPVDPATGQAVSTESSHSSPYGKPKLPDFSKLREKALKSELERKANESNQLEQSYNVSLKNIEQLQAGKKQLEALLAANPGENERMTLLKALGDIDRKISLSSELVKLIGNEGNVSDNRKDAIASLTPEQFQRAVAIQQELFAAAKGKSGEPTPPRSLFPEFKTPPKDAQQGGEDEEEYQPRSRKYRPGQIKPFYQELKKAQQRAQEENSHD